MERTVSDIPTMYSEMMILMKMQGEPENSRNGRVLTLPEPLTITVTTPTMRVLTDPIRRANPFFHVMEFVWMMSGSNRPEWISQFNSRFVEYADTHNVMREPIIHGAYGHRWRRRFLVDQIKAAVKMLRKDPESRRVVLGMWSPGADLNKEHNDLPCNTHIYLRIVDGHLDMTVCNRSNDVIWGMTGANAVHMTFLQELLALAIGVPIGSYRVFTNNAHVYTDLPNVNKMLETKYPVYYFDERSPIPLLAEGEDYRDLLDDCQILLAGDGELTTHWVREVALPIRNIYLDRKLAPYEDYEKRCGDIKDSEWSSACKGWLEGAANVSR